MDVRPPLRRLVLALCCTAALPACLSLVGGGDGSECETDGDCFSSDRCDTDAHRCVSALDPGNRLPDTGPADVRDMRPPVGDVPDVEPLRIPDGAPELADRALDDAGDMTMLAPPDLPDLSIPDVQSLPDVPDAQLPDVGVNGIYAPGGDCFQGDASGTLTESEGPGVPRTSCSDEALLWTTTTPEGVTSLHLRQGASEGELGILPAGSNWVLREAVLLLELPNPRADGIQNVFRADLTGGFPEPAPVEPSPERQWHAGRGPGLTGYVQGTADGEESSVRLRFDDNRRFDCVEMHRRQWGLTIGEDFAAWFEQPVAGGPVELVATRGHVCERRVAVALPGVVDRSERLQHDGGQLYWLALDTASGRRQIHTADAHALIAGAGPLSVQGITLRTPVEFVVHDGWLLLTSLERNGYRLHLYDLVGGLEQPSLGQGSARAPGLSGRYALWAQQSGGDPWEIRYAHLPRRR